MRKNWQMKIINSSFEILDKIDGSEILKFIELCGRVCYKSEKKISADSAQKFIKNILTRNHESVLEHRIISVRIICDRGVSHEIVRHRVGSYSQESQRYCRYVDEKFGNEITVIKPCFWDEDSEKYTFWKTAMIHADVTYKLMIESGATAEEARSVLPNSSKTEIICTYNLRQWRHFFLLRTSKAAHKQMREITIPLLKKFQESIPIIFDDIKI